MSATRMLFNLMFGLVLAGGTFYVRQHPEFIRKWMMAQPTKAGGADIAKTLGGDPNAEIAKLEQEVDKQVNDGATPQAEAPQSPHSGQEQVIPPTAMETMQAARALARQMNGQTQTGNSSEDRILDQMDADEKGEAAVQAAAAANAARNPAAAGSAKPESTVIVMDGTNGFDPAAEDKINAMMVPESVKKEILANYRRTGIMPTLNQAK